MNLAAKLVIVSLIGIASVYALNIGGFKDSFNEWIAGILISPGGYKKYVAGGQ